MARYRREILQTEATFIASVVLGELPDVDADRLTDAIYTALVALESGSVAARLFVEYHRGATDGRPQLLASFRRLIDFWPEWWALVTWVAARFLKRR